MATQPNQRIILGLKVKQLRLDKGLSFKNLSESTGMSVSYLNEIEKGKKYPKKQKIQLLAKALETTEAALTSDQLTHGLAPVGALLQSNFLNELPLDLFGIDLSKVVDIVANAPLKVGAFISTLVELSRTYQVREENFYFRALRAYQELHNNYFEDIESESDRFVKLYDIPIGEAVEMELLGNILKERFGYEIVEGGLDKYPELSHLRSVFIPKSKQLLLHSKLNDMQKAFQLAKELGFGFLGLKERPYTSSFHKVNSFEEVLNNYKAGYFAVAILVNRESFVRDLKHFFNQNKWDSKLLKALTEKYQASPTVLFQRFNVLPKYFGLENSFFLRFFHNLPSDQFVINKELHLNRKHRPHSNGLDEHYCRRWLSLSLLKQLKQEKIDESLREPIFGIQRSQYIGTNDEYICVTMARPSYPTPNRNASITIGVLIDENAKKTIKFLDDPDIPKMQVNVTCERCALSDCVDRAVEPTAIQRRERQLLIENRLKKLFK